MKIKVIDLLNKIANGEEVPEKVNFDGFIFEKDLETDYTCFVKNGDFKYLLNEVFLSQLNDEIEIIEGPKKIEKITVREKTLGFPNGEWTARNMDKAFAIKINGLIDEINSLKEND